MAQTAATTPADETLAQRAAGSNPFRDVPANHWAYQAVQQLSADGLVQGYPNGTFRGDRPLTRYEMAVIINRAVNAVESKMASGGSVSPADLAAVRRLVDEFGNELKAVQNQVAALNRRVDALSRDEAAIAARARGASPGFSMWVRPTSWSEQVTATAGPANPAGAGNVANAPLTTGTVTFSPGHAGTALNTLPVGTKANGGVWQAARFFMNGQIDPRWSYQFRIEQQMLGESPVSGLTGSNPSFCTSSACTPTAGFQDFPGNLPLRLNYADLVYTSPSGMFAKVGRITTDSGRWNESGWVYGGGQDNGVQLGYVDKRWNAWIFGAYGASSNSITAASNALCPVGAANCVRNNSVGFLAKADYWIPQMTLDLGATYNSWSGIVNTSYNPLAGLCATTPGSTTAAVTSVNAFTVACPAGTSLVRVTAPGPGGAVLGAPITGAYQTTQTSISAGSLFAVKLFGNHARPQFKAVAEGEMRFGNDPLTSLAWNGNKSFYGELAFSSKGHLAGGPLLPGLGVRNDNDVQFNYYNIGLNGTGVEGGPYGSATWQGFYYGNQNGFQNYLLMFDHWFTDNVRVGIGFQHWNLQNGITIPASSVTCPGCYVNGVNANAVFLESWLFF